MLCTFNLQPTSPATMMECILLRLPGEIRIRILQYLLKSLQPLDGLSEFNYGKSKADRAQWVQPRFVRSWGDWSYVRQRNFHFSPQILRVCQQLYNEGIPVLYEQNSLTIHAFTNGRKDGIYADILDGLALDSSREYAPKLESRLVRLRDIASVYLNIKLTSSFLCKEPQTYLADEYPAYPSGIVPKILDLRAPGPDILSGKDITIHIETMDNQSKLLPTELHQAVIAMFSGLQEIRCKSVKVMIGDIEISPLWAIKMISKDPVFSIINMKRCLVTWLDRIEWPDDRDMQHHRAMGKAEEVCDGERFRELRNLLYDEADARVATQRSENNGRWGK